MSWTDKIVWTNSTKTNNIRIMVKKTDNSEITVDEVIGKIVLLEGDYTTTELPEINGIESVSEKENNVLSVKINDNTTTLNLPIPLRSLPNNVCDTIEGNKLVQRVGKVVLENIKDNDVVCSIIDCKNNNCYFALYEKKNETFEILIEPQAESVNSCLAILKSYCEDTLANSSIYFVGNGSEIYKDEIKSTFSEAEFFSHEFNILNSISLGIAGFEKSKLGINSEEILPLYLKKPQAQRQLEEREHK